MKYYVMRGGVMCMFACAVCGLTLHTHGCASWGGARKGVSGGYVFWGACEKGMHATKRAILVCFP